MSIVYKFSDLLTEKCNKQNVC